MSVGQSTIIHHSAATMLHVETGDSDCRITITQNSGQDDEVEGNAERQCSSAWKDSLNGEDHAEGGGLLLSQSYPQSRFSPSNAKRKLNVSKTGLMMSSPKGKKASRGGGQQNAEVNIKARHWSFLFETLRRTVDSIYDTCRQDRSVIECKEAIMILRNSANDFESLIQCLQVEDKWEENQKPTAVAWEIRKTVGSPSKPLPPPLSVVPSSTQLLLQDFKPITLPTVTEEDRRVLEIACRSSSNGGFKSPEDHSQMLSKGSYADKVRKRPTNSGNVNGGKAGTFLQFPMADSSDGALLQRDAGDNDETEQNEKERKGICGGEDTHSNAIIKNAEKDPDNVNDADCESNKDEDDGWSLVKRRVERRRERKAAYVIPPGDSDTESTYGPIVPQNVGAQGSGRTALLKGTNLMAPRSAMDIPQTRSSMAKMAYSRRLLWEKKQPQYKEKLAQQRRETPPYPKKSGSFPLISHIGINFANPRAVTRKAKEEKEMGSGQQTETCGGGADSLSNSRHPTPKPSEQQQSSSTRLPGGGVEGLVEDDKRFLVEAQSLPDKIQLPDDHLLPVSPPMTVISGDTEYDDDRDCEHRGPLHQLLFDDNDQTWQNLTEEEESLAQEEESLVKEIEEEERKSIDAELEHLQIGRDAENLNEVGDEEEDCDGIRGEGPANEMNSLERDGEGRQGSPSTSATPTAITSTNSSHHSPPSTTNSNTPTPVMSWQDVVARWAEESKALTMQAWSQLVEEEMAMTTDIRRPGQGAQMHEKLSSPSRKRNPEDTVRKHEEKLAKADELRKKLLVEKAARLKDLSVKVEEVRNKRQAVAERKAQLLNDRMDKAKANREMQLDAIRKKAKDEDEKVHEIAFIRDLEQDGKRLDAVERNQNLELRLQSIHDERQRKADEKAAREAAAEGRRKVFEEERERKLMADVERRKKRAEKVSLQKEEIEREKQIAAKEKAKEREERLAEIRAAKLVEQAEQSKAEQLLQKLSSSRKQNVISGEEEGSGGGNKDGPVSTQGPCNDQSPSTPLRRWRTRSECQSPNANGSSNKSKPASSVINNNNNSNNSSNNNGNNTQSINLSQSFSFGFQQLSMDATKSAIKLSISSKPFAQPKFCTLCNHLIWSEMHLIGHVEGLSHVKALKETTVNGRQMTDKDLISCIITATEEQRLMNNQQSSRYAQAGNCLDSDKARASKKRRQKLKHKMALRLQEYESWDWKKSQKDVSLEQNEISLKLSKCVNEIRSKLDANGLERGIWPDPDVLKTQRNLSEIERMLQTEIRSKKSMVGDAKSLARRLWSLELIPDLMKMTALLDREKSASLPFRISIHALRLVGLMAQISVEVAIDLLYGNWMISLVDLMTGKLKGILSETGCWKGCETPCNHDGMGHGNNMRSDGNGTQQENIRQHPRSHRNNAVETVVETSQVVSAVFRMMSLVSSERSESKSIALRNFLPQPSDWREGLLTRLSLFSSYFVHSGIIDLMWGWTESYPLHQSIVELPQSMLSSFVHVSDGMDEKGGLSVERGGLLVSSLCGSNCFGLIPYVYTRLIWLANNHRSAVDDNDDLLEEMDIWTISRLLKMMNSIASLDRQAFTEMINEEGKREILRDIMMHLCGHSSPSRHTHSLFHPLIIFMGHFALFNKPNQDSMSISPGYDDGKNQSNLESKDNIKNNNHQRRAAVNENNQLEDLCKLPFGYFSKRSLSRYLYPTLISITFNHQLNTKILEKELTGSLLSEFIQEEKQKIGAGSESGNPAGEDGEGEVGGVESDLIHRLPRSQWDDAIKYFDSL